MIAATLSPILGLICSLIAWLVTAKKEGGVRIFEALVASYLTSSNYETRLWKSVALGMCSTACCLPARGNTDSEIINRTFPSLAQAASQSRQDLYNPTIANTSKVTPCWRATSLRYSPHVFGCRS